MTDRTGQVVIITGGASGIGKAIAREFGQRGGILLLADIDQTALNQTVAEFNSLGFKSEGYKLDVTDAKAFENLINNAKHKYSRIDFLFNNAGINVTALFPDTTLDDWDRQIDVNLRGVIHGTKAVYPIMIEQGFGHIINTASITGLVPLVSVSAYSATKHAVVGFSVSLRAEAAPQGVKVSVLCPGLTATPLLKNSTYRGLEADKVLSLPGTKLMSVEVLAQRAYKDISKNKNIIVIPGIAKFLWAAYRITAQHWSLMMRWHIKKMRMGHG